MKDTIVLYPNIGRGHLVSMVELGKLILSHHPSLSITILLLTPSPNYPATLGQNSNAQYVAAVSAAIPAISFQSVPLAPLPPDTLSLPPHLTSLELSRHSTQNVALALQSLAKACNLKALIMDFLNFSDPNTLTQNLETKIPTFFYFTSVASCLVLLFYSSTVVPKQVVQDQQLQLHFPGLPAISTDDFPNDCVDPLNHINQIFSQIAETMKGGSGIIINTCEAMEERAIAVLNNDGTVPPVFCVGPVMSAPYGEEDKGCLSWLDSQPSQSVVFLCFGSLGCFSRKQLMEMAIALEKSEQRFLWVVKTKLEAGDSGEKPSLDELLPEGFLERTKEKGLVVRDWAPQREILSHDSVGGFVTHCGWNSVLEAVWEGVPMVAWPLYAEQKLNRVLMVQEMKVALGVKEDKDGFVSSTELEERVRELMESDTGKEIRQRVFKMKLSAAEALGEGGTSHAALDKLTMLWKTSFFTV